MPPMVGPKLAPLPSRATPEAYDSPVLVSVTMNSRLADLMPTLAGSKATAITRLSPGPNGVPGGRPVIT